MNRIPEIVCMLLAAVLSGCSFGDEPGVCPYTTRLDYWYAGNSSDNLLPVYVDNLHQYLFDGEGRLIGTATLRGDSIGSWQGNLDEGDYTVVLWGNLAEDGSDKLEVLPPVDRRLDEMTLTAVTSEAPPGYRANTSRLYYGYLSFHVEEGKMFHRRIYLSHAHASLRVTVHWMADTPPEDGTYRMRMKGIASGTHQLWSLWRNDERIVGDLDLYRFFSKKPMNMDQNIEQEFEILVTVYADKVVVSEITESDWDEGGAIG